MVAILKAVKSAYLGSGSTDLYENVARWRILTLFQHGGRPPLCKLLKRHISATIWSPLNLTVRQRTLLCSSFVTFTILA